MKTQTEASPATETSWERRGREHWEGLSENGRQRLLAERNPSDVLSDTGCAAWEYGRRVSRG